MRSLRITLSSILLLILTGCFSVGTSRSYQGPPQRPQEVLDYYSTKGSYSGYEDAVSHTIDDLAVHRIIIHSWAGDTTVDYYARPEKSDSLVLVFPILGGGNKIADYFAEYFAHAGFDTAIVHRSNDFKDPALFFNLEEVFRNNVIRDRIALDFFEQTYDKKQFGSFGISRGAINVVMTAGVDERLKYNVAALGATDLVRIMKNSNEKRIDVYKHDVMTKYSITEREFFSELTNSIETDPKELAKYMDARNTLLVFGLLDKTVPIQYGIKLRREIGGPKTLYLLADHYLSVGFTGLAKIASPKIAATGFPIDYLEREALGFYKKSFRDDARVQWNLVQFHILQAPLNFLAAIVDAATDWPSAKAPVK